MTDNDKLWKFEEDAYSEAERQPDQSLNLFQPRAGLTGPSYIKCEFTGIFLFVFYCILIFSKDSIEYLLTILTNLY